MVRRWVQDVLGMPALPSAADARDRDVAAAPALGHTPWELDHAIWLHQRQAARLGRPKQTKRRTNMAVREPRTASP